MQKKLLVSLLSLAALCLAAGCASFESAYYVDREFGQASQASFDQQILYPDYRYADPVPQGNVGIIAEEIMAVHIQTYSEKPTKMEVFEMGVIQ
jgi:hypothetical protein